MKAITTRFAARKEIGLAIGELELAACVMAATPIGRIEVGRFRVPYEPDRLAPALEELLTSCLSLEERPRALVTIGLPALRVFFSARPIQDEHQGASPAALLHEVLQSPTLNIDDMIVDMIKHRQGQKTLACIVSCRKRYLNTVLAALQTCGIQPSRAEPAPCALLRHAAKLHKPPRGARSFVRVFLGKEHGLAVLVTDGDLPLMWRPFDLRNGSESDAILAAVASVRSPGVYCGLETDIDAVLIHGRPDLGGFAEFTANPLFKNVRTQRHDAPALGGEETAFGLALRPSLKIESFNLVRSFASVVAFRDIFPWGQTVLHAVVLIAATLLLQSRLAGHRAEASAVKAEDAKFAWAANLSTEKLTAEKQKLEQRVESIRSFIGSRSIWTNYARDLAGRLPPDLSLISVTGNHELETPGVRGPKPKHSMVLSLNAPIPKTGAMPREVDAFLGILRDDPLLKREFPDIELAELRWAQVSGKAPSANFIVVCQPIKTAPPKPVAGGETKAKAK